MIKKHLRVLLVISVFAISLTGCEDKTETSAGVYFPEEIPLVTNTTSESTSVSEEIESTVSFDTKEEEKVETVDYKLLITNQCNADIGMVCMLDPVTAEQKNIGPLADSMVLSLDFKGWPLDVTTLDLAFYNNNGELVSSTEVDITGVKSMVTVALSGDGNIEKVKGDIN